MSVRGDTEAGPALSFRDRLFGQIESERYRQDRKYGAQHDSLHVPLDWARIICDLAIKAAEEDQSAPWSETVAEREIIKVAATAIAWIEARSRESEHQEEA